MIYKRGKHQWMRFRHNGKIIHRSTKVTSATAARSIEKDFRDELREEHQQRQKRARKLGCTPAQLERCPECESLFEVALAVVAFDGSKLCSEECQEKRQKHLSPIPTLKQFCETRITPWARATFEKTTPKSWAWYRTEMKGLTSYLPLAERRLNAITGELVSEFKSYRLRDEYQISSVNSSLRVLRRVLNLAAEWGVIDVAPKIKLLSGERHRERVINREEEARYLAAAPEPLASVATVLADTGMRPEECFRLRWESITWTNGRHGTLLVTHGKTAAARRVIPLTPRVRAILECLWETSSRPEEGWVWTAPTRSGHVEPSSVRKQHSGAFKKIAAQSPEPNLKPVRPFVLYSLRHTFLTRLGESGCDVWTLARIAGHSSITISSRYVHPSDDVILSAMSKFGPSGDKLLSTVNQNVHQSPTEESAPPAKLLN